MRRVLAVALGLLALVALAQVPVELQMPGGSALMLSSDRLVFDLRQTAYPPAEFPAYYPATTPEGPLELRVFSNIDGGWFLSATLTPLVSESGRAIDPDRIEMRVDGGIWFPLGNAVVLFVGQGPSEAYERYLVELRLRLEGNERPGFYRGNLTFTLARP